VLQLLFSFQAGTQDFNTYKPYHIMKEYLNVVVVEPIFTTSPKIGMLAFKGKETKTPFPRIHIILQPAV